MGRGRRRRSEGAAGAWRRAGLAVSLAAVIPNVAAAQTGFGPRTAQVGAAVTLIDGAAAQGLHDLCFGTLPRGQARDLPAPQAPQGTRPTVSGTCLQPHWAVFLLRNIRDNRVYSVTFSLPSALTNGANSVSISFGGTQYGYACVVRNSTTCLLETNFNPTVTYLIDLPNLPGQGFDVYVFLGGRVPATGTIPSTTPPGLYTGTITLTLQRI